MSPFMLTLTGSHPQWLPPVPDAAPKQKPLTERQSFAARRLKEMKNKRSRDMYRKVFRDAGWKDMTIQEIAAIRGVGNTNVAAWLRGHASCVKHVGYLELPGKRHKLYRWIGDVA